MSATCESPLAFRRAQHRLVVAPSALFRSSSTQSDLAAGVKLTAPAKLSKVELMNGLTKRSGSPVTLIDGRVKEHQSGVGGFLKRVLGIKCCRQQAGDPRPMCKVLSQSSDRLFGGIRDRSSSPCDVQRFGTIAPPVVLSPGVQLRIPNVAVVVPDCAAPHPVPGTAVTCGPCDAGVQANGTGPVRPVRPELVAEMVRDCELSSHLLLLDCRTFLAFNANHVRGSVNVSCSDCISRKRLQCGRATLGDLVSGSDDAKERYRLAVEMAARSRNGCGTTGFPDGDRAAMQVVIYDEETTDWDSLAATHPLRLVADCLRKAGVEAYYMHGGLKAFHSQFSCLCSQPGSPVTCPLVYCPKSPVDCPIDNAPVSLILPGLYIGNERDAADRDLLSRLGVRHVINVTSHVPLHFESDGVQYLRLTAADSGVQNLRQYFDTAIRFIDDVRSQGSTVLVHCQAGVSRSSTVTIAYVMARSTLGMLDAFRFVKSRRSIVAPNFNFMGQLLEFETSLTQGGGSVTHDPRPDLVTFISECQGHSAHNSNES